MIFDFSCRRWTLPKDGFGRALCSFHWPDVDRSYGGSTPSNSNDKNISIMLTHKDSACKAAADLKKNADCLSHVYLFTATCVN